MTDPQPGGPLPQTMAEVTANQITVRGFDLCADLLGTIDFGDMVFLEVVGRLPDAAESRLTNAVLVCLAEHGLTASAIATRLTALGSPGSVQSAIAVGILGAGDLFLGALEGAAQLLRAISAE